MSGRGWGLRSGRARSIRASTHEPSSIDLREQEDLADGPRALALQPRRGQSGLRAGPLEQPVAEGQDLLRDRAQELRAPKRRERGVRLERPLGRTRGRVDLARRRLEELALERGAGRGVPRPERRAGRRDGAHRAPPRAMYASHLIGEHRQRHGAAAEHDVVERAHVELGPERLLRLSAQLPDLQLPHLVAERLPRPGDVAVDLGPDLVEREGRVRFEVVDRLRARPALRVDAGVHDQPAGAPHLVGQAAEVAVRDPGRSRPRARAARRTAPSPRRTRRRPRSAGTPAGPSSPAAARSAGDAPAPPRAASAPRACRAAACRGRRC